MASHTAYFRWAARLVWVYAALLFGSWAVMTATLGWAPYDPSAATATKLLLVYADPGAATSARLETAASLILLPFLPAFAIFLARKTPGLAWGGLALGATATVLSLTARLIEAPAFVLSAPGADPALLAAVPPSDIILLINTLSDAVAFPAMLLYYPWLILWGLGFWLSGDVFGRVAGVAAAAVTVAALISFMGFLWHLPPLATVGVFAQTAAEAATFVLGGLVLRRASKVFPLPVVKRPPRLNSPPAQPV